MNKIIGILLVGVLLTSGCAITREESGTVAGGVVGAVVGATGAKILGGGKTTQWVVGSIGAVTGAVAGGNIGRSMDRQDRVRTQSAINKMPTGRTSSWRNPDTNRQYDVTPQKTYYSAKTRDYCREVIIGEATIGGKRQQTYSTACRQPDGTWKLK